MAKAARVKKVAAPPVEGTVVINSMPIILRAADRSRKDVGDWWDALQISERSIMPNRTRLYDLYSTIVIDGHLTGIMEKRIAAIVNKRVCFKKDNKEQKYFDALTDTSQFHRLLRELMLQKFWGLSGFEFIPGPSLDFNCIPRKHIKPEKQTISAEQNLQSGFSYSNLWNIWVVGQPDDFGLLLKCAPYVIWKKGNMGDWAQYIEIFGQPFVVGKYNGFDQKTREELDQTMRNFGGSNRMMIPNEAGVEIIDGKTTSNGNGDLQDKFRQACNDELSVLVLGVTETTTSSNSSGYAQSKTHSRQQDIIFKADMIDIMDLLNSDQFLNIVRSYGYNVDGGHFYFEEETDINEQQQRLNIATQVKKITPVSDDYIYEVSGIPKPDNYDELKQGQDPASPDDPPQDPGEDPSPGEEDPADITKALKGLSFWQKMKAVFSDAP